MYLRNSGKIKPLNLYPSKRDISLSRNVTEGEVNIVEIHVIKKTPRQVSICLADMEVKSVEILFLSSAILMPGKDLL